MTQFARPTPAAADYDSTIIGALELSEKKWVLAVHSPPASASVVTAAVEEFVSDRPAHILLAIGDVADAAILAGEHERGWYTLAQNEGDAMPDQSVGDDIDDRARRRHDRCSKTASATASGASRVGKCPISSSTRRR